MSKPKRTKPKATTVPRQTLTEHHAERARVLAQPGTAREKLARLRALRHT